MNYDADLRRAAKAARLNNEHMRLFGSNGQLLSNEDAHYHVMYDDVVHIKVVYETAKLAFEEVYRLGVMSEPNTEWYEEGPVRIETRLEDRTGLHRVLLQVVECRNTCRRTAESIHQVEEIS